MLHHQQLIVSIVHLIADYRYVIIFPLAVIEGPVVTVAAGILAAAETLDPVIAFFVLVAADLVGDAAYYALGRFGHAKFFNTFAERLGIAGDKLGTAAETFKAHEVKFLLFGKTQAFGSVILYTCGALRMRFEKFMFWNLISTAPKVLIFLLIGYYFGQTIIRASRILDAVALATFALGILLVVLYLLIRKRAEREFEGTMGADSPGPRV